MSALEMSKGIWEGFSETPWQFFAATGGEMRDSKRDVSRFSRSQLESFTVAGGMLLASVLEKIETAKDMPVIFALFTSGAAFAIIGLQNMKRVKRAEKFIRTQMADKVVTYQVGETVWSHVEASNQRTPLLPSGAKATMYPQSLKMGPAVR